MVDDLVFRALPLLALFWLCLLLYWIWLQGQPTPGQTTPAKPIKARATEPKLLVGLLHKPSCDACEPAVAPRSQASFTPPPRLAFTRGRQRTIDTQRQFCPEHECAYYGWVGHGNIRANGHPSGKPWRQLHCLGCQSYFQETHGTPLQGKRVAPQTLVWAVGALAEGLGIRAVARVFEVDPNTVLQWLSEVADHTAAFSRYFLHDLRLTQVQLDELFALLSAVKAGEVSKAEASERLSRSPHWVWAAIDPSNSRSRTWR